MESALAFLSLLGVAVFAASGALAANEEKFDLIGALFLSGVAGLGGGTIVDLLTGADMVRWVKDPVPLWVALGAGGAVFVLARFTHMPHQALIWADAVGLAVFTAAGMERLTMMGLQPGVAVFLATILACGGGILRDVLANRTPIVFSPETELYVTAAFAGGAAYLIAAALAPGAALPAALIVTLAVRAAALMFGWRLIRGSGRA
ncbi:MAG TPA: TRIC cation channel family protein [Caulobacterales bacterium]|jgi:uncharacterized membrane protein YeiH|nr:TRIC cation channel family protein [Caulobacterales bacterium]